MLKSIIFVICFYGLLFSQPLDPKIFFNKIQKKNQQILPEFFKVLIESSVIDLQKETFPPEMLEFNKQPNLYLLFKKGYSPILHLEGVLEYYANYFAPYEKVIQNTGIFLGVDNYNSFKKFSKEFLIRSYTTSYGYRFKVREREGLSGDYGEYFYNRELELSRINFYKDGKLHGTMKVFYKKINDSKSVPSKAVINYEKPEIGGLKEFSLNFTKYETNPKLGDKFFLQ